MLKLVSSKSFHTPLKQSIVFVQAISVGILLALASCDSRSDNASTPGAVADNSVQVQPNSPPSVSPGSSTAPVDSPSDMTVDPSSTNILDNNLIVKGAQDNLFEIQAGQLAAQKAASPDVKQFVQKMVQDHTQATSMVQQIAAKRNITLPTDMGEQNQALLSRLTNLSGVEFDRAYMAEMINSHQKDVALLQNQAQNGKDQELKALAAQKLPALEEHLSMAQSLAQRINS